MAAVRSQASAAVARKEAMRLAALPGLRAAEARIAAQRRAADAKHLAVAAEVWQT